MTPSIEIVDAQALCTVQDLGRFGQRTIGVGTAGAMDTLALRIGNILLGNCEAAAGIEVPTFPFACRFAASVGFAVTGAPCPVTLDGLALPPNWATTAAAGQVLRVGAPPTGARAYLTIAGGLDVPGVLGSRSTDLRSGFGGYEGRALRTGDVLGHHPGARPLPDGGRGAVRPALEAEVTTVRCMHAGEHDLFAPDMQNAFWTARWRITAQSNRAGYRLSGPSLMLPAPVELRSQPIVPGVVQVPPSGQPIIQMSDANTAGGYPKMAVVIPSDLWRLGQARLGSSVRFVKIGLDEAIVAADPDRRYLATLRSLMDLHDRPATLIHRSKA